ncbi:MAG: DnaA/Hda family protein [Silicimonas sp.]|nr:DnaA/Hda family protein [Silicimonas sp.]
MARQLTFDLAARPALGRGDFFVSEANALALARLDASATWPNGKLVLTGPEGAGKTHLAHVWAGDSGAAMVELDDLPGLAIGEIASPIVVEDADRLGRAAETPLFHLHNHLAAHGLPLLLTAERAPSRWDIALPDLRSRLEAAEIARISAPDDALLAAVLMKLFADRQITVAPAIISWLTTRMDRSFAEARRIVTELDARALAEGRKVTRDLAAAVLHDRPDDAS